MSPYFWGAAQGCDHLHKNSRRSESRDFLSRDQCSYACLTKRADLACNCPVAQPDTGRWTHSSPGTLCMAMALDGTLHGHGTSRWTLDARPEPAQKCNHRPVLWTPAFFSQHMLLPSHQWWINRNHPAVETRSYPFHEASESPPCGSSGGTDPARGAPIGASTLVHVQPCVIVVLEPFHRRQWHPLQQ